MKKICFLIMLIFLFAVPSAVLAAPAQKYSLYASDSKLTAYMIEDAVYVRPQELASAFSGTTFNYDVEFESGIMMITLKKDFSGEVSKLKSKSAYDDIGIIAQDFRVAGYDATGSVSSAVIEDNVFIKLSDMAGIVGFTYTRNKETGELSINRSGWTSALLNGNTLSSDDYINMFTDFVYGSIASNNDVNVITKSTDIARMLAPGAYTVEGIKTAADSPLAKYFTGSITASLRESDTRDIDPDKPMVALTFDDGPREGNTERILEALDAVDGRATFFMVGTNVENYPDTVRAVAEQGSEIGNHTYSHPQLTSLGVDGAMAEINKTNGLIYDITGVTPTIGRPPYGSIDENIINASGMEWFNWNIDTLDWKTRNADSVYSVVMDEVTDRDVILMHDIHESTINATLRIIPKLHEMGYQLVTLSELCEVMDGAENVSGHIVR